MADDGSGDRESTRRHDGGVHRGATRSSPYPVSRLAPPHDLVDTARQIQQADAMLGAVVGNKLEVIARQIRSLQEEARTILERARTDSDLHRAECHFRKRPGAIYHLYRRDDERTYLSMLSPQEWGGDPPHEFAGSYRLEADMSWTPAEEIDDRDRERAVVHRLLGE